METMDSCIQTTEWEGGENATYTLGTDILILDKTDLAKMDEDDKQ
jgi:hypothetical protein